MLLQVLVIPPRTTQIRKRFEQQVRLRMDSDTCFTCIVLANMRTGVLRQRASQDEAPRCFLCVVVLAIEVAGHWWAGELCSFPIFLPSAPNTPNPGVDGPYFWLLPCSCRPGPSTASPPLRQKGGTYGCVSDHAEICRQNNLMQWWYVLGACCHVGCRYCNCLHVTASLLGVGSIYEPCGLKVVERGWSRIFAGEAEPALSNER